MGQVLVAQLATYAEGEGWFKFPHSHRNLNMGLIQKKKT